MSPIPTNIPITHTLNFVILNILYFNFLRWSITTILSYVAKKSALLMNKYGLLLRPQRPEKKKKKTYPEDTNMFSRHS